MVTIGSPFCGYNTICCVELNGEDLSCYSDKTESVSFWKCSYDDWLTNKAYLSAVTVINIYQRFTYKMAAKINWHRCGTKLRHCHRTYNCPFIFLSYCSILYHCLTCIHRVPKTSTFYFLNNSVKILMIFGTLNPEKNFDMKIVQICPPHLSAVVTLPWENQKQSFSTVLFTYFWLFVLSQKKTNCNPLPNPT